MKQADASETPIFCFYRSLRLASERLGELYGDVLAPTGLKPLQFAMLTEVARTGDLSLQALGARFMLDRSSVRYRLKPLIAAGLVEIVEGVRDRRGRRALLTEAGQTRLATARPLWLDAQARFEKSLGAEDAAILRGSAQTVASVAFAEAFGAGRSPDLRRESLRLR